MYKISLLAAVVFLSVSFNTLKKKSVVFFGDSITELGVKPGGYIQRIDSMCRAAHRSADFDFAGAGIGGNKVYDLYLRMEEDILAKKPDVVFIYIGVNDIWHKTLLGTGTDADKFQKFYLAIIKKLKEHNIKPVLCTPAVIGELKDCTNTQDGDLNKYSGIIRKLAADNNLALVDLRKLFLDHYLTHNPDNKDKGILTTDKVHLNSAGNQLVADAMWHVLKNE